MITEGKLKIMGYRESQNNPGTFSISLDTFGIYWLVVFKIEEGWGTGLLLVGKEIYTAPLPRTLNTMPELEELYNVLKKN